MTNRSDSHAAAARSETSVIRRGVRRIRAFLRRARRENPEEYIHSLYLDMQKRLAEARRVTAAAVGREKRSLHRLEDQRKNVDRCDQRATAALRNDEEDRAALEMERKRSELEYLRTLEREHAELAESVEQLRRDLAALLDQVESAENKKVVLLARLRDERSRERVEHAITEIGHVTTGDLFSILERLSRPVPERDPESEVIALTDPTGSEMLEDLKRRLQREENP